MGTLVYLTICGANMARTPTADSTHSEKEGLIHWTDDLALLRLFCVIGFAVKAFQTDAKPVRVIAVLRGERLIRGSVKTKLNRYLANNTLQAAGWNPETFDSKALDDIVYDINRWFAVRRGAKERAIFATLPCVTLSPEGWHWWTEVEPVLDVLDTVIDRGYTDILSSMSLYKPRNGWSRLVEGDQQKKFGTQTSEERLASYRAYLAAAVSVDAERKQSALILQHAINQYLMHVPQGLIEEKREVARWINDQLELRGYGVKCPKYKVASRVTVSSARDPDIGLFRLYHMKNSKQYDGGRLETLINIEILPFQIDDPKQSATLENHWVEMESTRRESQAGQEEGRV